MEIRPILLSLKRNKFMALLMVVQIALTMTVLSNAVLTAASTLKEWNKPSGIPHQDVIRIFAEFYDPSQDVGSAMQRDLERIRQIDGVKHVARTNMVPFASERLSQIFVEADEQAQPHTTVVYQSDVSLFETLNLDLVEGRWLTLTDQIVAHADEGLTASNVMISQDMAEALFAQQSAVGRTIWLKKAQDPVQVVGVYSNFMGGERINGQGKSYHSVIRPQVIYSQNQPPEFLIRVESGQAEALLETFVTAFYQEQGRYVATSELLKRVQKRMYDGRGSRALTSLVIAVVLLFITAAGITGLTSFQMNQKRKQIGARRALGARKSDIIRYFITENSVISCAGFLIGLPITLYLLFEMSQLSEQNYFNFGIVALIIGFMWFINALATYIPARKAADVSPSIITRGG